MIDARWLRGLGAERLTALLERRPETLAAPVPESLAELAERLLAASAVVATLRRLDLPTLQVAEALAALGGAAERSALDRLLGVPDRADRQEVDRAVATLHEHALLLDGPHLVLVPAARQAWPEPLGLGAPATQCLTRYTAEDLRGIASALGIRVPSRKAEMLDTVAAAIGDADRMRLVVAAAPAAAQELLRKVALTGEPVHDYGYFSVRHGKPDTPTRWAIARGLLVRAGDWDARLEMPAEVGLALRGPDYTAPFHPVPPQAARASADAAGTARDATAAGAVALRLVTALLDEAGRTTLPRLRAGGLGVREVRRLAKRLGCSVGEIRLGLAVAHQAGLVAFTADALAPTDRYDDWLRAEPVERLAELVQAWWALPYAPLLEPEAAWAPTDPADGTPELRAAALAEAARVPGTAVVDSASLAEGVLWRQPYAFPSSRARAIVAVGWREAAWLGVVAGGAVAAAGEALLAADEPALRAALAGVGSVERTVRIQGDLTAVVTGTPAAELADLLDAVADRESLGAATTWRFSPSSVRRALDAGREASTLLADLAAVAAGPLPQPLDYLVRDVARRHGAVRGCEVACCLRGEDPALLAEIAADRRLRGLGLRVLAPTVLAGARPLTETLAALRAAGYAPVAESADGTPILERATRHRAKIPAARSRDRAGLAAASRHTGPDARRSERPAAAARRTDTLVRSLLAKPDAMPAASATVHDVRVAAPQLSEGEARILAHAIDHGGAVAIDYVNQAGSFSRRIIDAPALFGNMVTAWCRLRDDERVFTLSRIAAVAPAG